MLTINVIDILVLVFTYTLATDPDEVFASAKGHGLLGTGFNTCRGFAELQPGVVAEDAFHDSGVKSAGIFEGWNVKRTGYHAGPAAYTYLGVVHDGSFRGFGVGINKAGG